MFISSTLGNRSCSAAIIISNPFSSIEYGKWSGCCNFMTFRSTNEVARWSSEQRIVSEGCFLAKKTMARRERKYETTKNATWEPDRGTCLGFRQLLASGGLFPRDEEIVLQPS
ncbi:uncharacterized protein LOC125386170 isoform X3 [Bombus terrestris]|uniref:Uncharacterized protein LOC125386170 isoform X3 n=1 Tax=Bombus terrestris TaxID=30195 RepID=A0A9C6W9A6_BOMTE|nr:uncharacterized protein LOC125386170 isoform X3 [Bombus terrestris]